MAIDPAGRTVPTHEGVLIDVSTGGRRKAAGGEDLLRTAVFSPDGGGAPRGGLWACARAEGGATRAERRGHLPNVPHRQAC